MKSLFNYILAIFTFMLIVSCKSDKKDVPKSEGTEVPSAEVIKTLGSSSNWSEWGEYNSSMLGEDGSIVLEGKQHHIFLGFPAKEFEGNKLQVVAKAIGNPELPYRLQINWHDSTGTYVTTSSEVVNLDMVEKSYSMLASPPSNAVTGYVYLTLHGTPTGKAVVKSVTILD